MSKSGFESLDILDQVPGNIYQRLITHQYRPVFDKTTNSLQKRATGIVEIRRNLLDGKAIVKDTLYEWVDIELADKLHEKLTEKVLLKNTFQNESFTDDVIMHVFNWLDYIDDEIKNGFSENSKEAPDAPLITDSISSDLDINIDELHTSMQDINDDFALQRNLGWDLSKGIKSKADLNQLISTHRIIKNSKKIQSIIRLLGRNKSGYFDQQEKMGLNQYAHKSHKINNALPDNLAINSVTGICLGDDISRMLSSELAMLGNPKLKMLWHSKRAERRLLNYHYIGLLSEHVPNVQAISINNEIKEKHSTKQSGPMILCVDTSASMKGRPEVIAKAIALEAMRVARLEKRKCYLYCFSGPDEITQLELNLDHSWDSIIEFLSISFHGGTDINNVLLQALNKQNSCHWYNADILLISDGRFDVNSKVLEKVNRSQSALRIFGLQLGQWRSSAYNAICHQVFDLSDV